MIIDVIGVTGSGKSTLAQVLCSSSTEGRKPFCSSSHVALAQVRSWVPKPFRRYMDDKRFELHQFGWVANLLYVRPDSTVSLEADLKQLTEDWYEVLKIASRLSQSNWSSIPDQVIAFQYFLRPFLTRIALERQDLSLPIICDEGLSLRPRLFGQSLEDVAGAEEYFSAVPKPRGLIVLDCRDPELLYKRLNARTLSGGKVAGRHAGCSVTEIKRDLIAQVNLIDMATAIFSSRNIPMLRLDARSSNNELVIECMRFFETLTISSAS